jgi:hypothetical protein
MVIIAYDIAVETPHPPMFDMAYNEPFIMKHHPEADIHMSRTTENLGRPLKIDIDLMNELDEMKKFDGKSRYLSVYKAMRGNPDGLEFDVENLAKEYDAFEPEYFASLPKPKYEVGDRVMFMIYPHWYVGTIEEVTFGNLDAPNYHSYKVSSPDYEYDHWDKESRIIPLGKE